MTERHAFPVLLALVLALTSLWGAGAQTESNATWTAWLFNANSNALVSVSLDGAVRTFVLPLMEGTYLYSYPTFSSDGGLAAYCVSDTQGNSTLYVRDIFAEANLVDHALGKVAGCSTGPAAFNEEATQVAVGVLNDYPGDPNADADRPSWELLVMALPSGEVVSRLDADTPALAGLDLMADFSQMGFMPMVQRFWSGQIAFAVMPWAVGGPPEVDGVVWDLATGAVSAVEPYGKVGLDILAATGEMIWLDTDESFPLGEPLPGPAPTFNVVMYGGAPGQQQVIFTEPMVLGRARFVDDGRRVAVHAVGAYDEQTGTAPAGWVAFDRRGAVEALPPELSDYNLVAAPGGFAILHTAYQGDAYTNPLTALRHYRFVEGEGVAYTALWEDPTDAWLILWSPPIAAAADRPAFAGVAP